MFETRPPVPRSAGSLSRQQIHYSSLGHQNFRLFGTYPSMDPGLVEGFGTVTG